jgi:hypothetical protein
MARTWRLPILLVLAAILLAGCITIGRDFSPEVIGKIRPGETTLEEVRQMLGEPVRTGVEDGRLVWTYARYHASLFGKFEGRDLAIKFDAAHRVLSFNYSTTDPSEELLLKK